MGLGVRRGERRGDSWGVVAGREGLKEAEEGAERQRLGRGRLWE